MACLAGDEIDHVPTGAGEAALDFVGLPSRGTGKGCCDGHMWACGTVPFTSVIPFGSGGNSRGICRD